MQLTFPLAGYVEDFHLQVGAPCRAHKRKGGWEPPFRVTNASLLSAVVVVSEIEQIEEIANGRAVLWHIGVIAI